jgi:shikimate kinase
MCLPLLIGPVAAGKSTLGPLVAARLELPFLDLDDVAETYYEEVGYGMAALKEVTAKVGTWRSYQWWQRAHPHAIRRGLEDYPGTVIALGAGQSVYDDPVLFEEVRGLLTDLHPVLVLPSPDLDRSWEVLRERSLRERDYAWVMDGVDLLDVWVRGPQNHELARSTVYTEGRTPGEVADEIAAL